MGFRSLRLGGAYYLRLLCTSTQHLEKSLTSQAELCTVLGGPKEQGVLIRAKWPLTSQKRTMAHRSVRVAIPSGIPHIGQDHPPVRRAGHSSVHPLSVQSAQPFHVAVLGEHLGLEPAHGVGAGRWSVYASVSNDYPHRRIVGQPFSIVGILVAYQTTVHRLPEKAHQSVLHVTTAPTLLQTFIRRLRQSQGIITPDRTRTGDYIYQGLPGSDWWWWISGTGLVVQHPSIEG